MSVWDNSTSNDDEASESNGREQARSFITAVYDSMYPPIAGCEILPEINIPADVTENVNSARQWIASPNSLDADISRLRDSASPDAVDAARALLSIDESASLTDAWKAQEALAKEDASQTMAAHDAYWTLVHSGENRKWLAEVEAKRDQLAQRDELARNDHWPEAWHPCYHQAWIKSGGTIDSAHAWAGSGWAPGALLSEPRIAWHWNPSLKERLTLTTVPNVNEPSIAATWTSVLALANENEGVSGKEER